MVQPPYPPSGGRGPGDDHPGSQSWYPPGSDEPTQQLDPPAEPQREPTRPLPQPGQYQSPGPWGSPDPYAPSGQYGPPPGQYGPPPGQYGPPPGQYPLPGQYGPPPGQYGPPDALHAQPVFGQPWGPAGGPQPPRQRNRNTVIALVVAGVLALAAVGAALFLFLGDEPGGTAAEERQTSSGSDLPAPTSDPDGLGEDPFLDDLAQSCYDGDMRACDRLYDQSDAGSDYETYGDTCAGRQPSGTFDYCTETFPED